MNTIGLFAGTTVLFAILAMMGWTVALNYRGESCFYHAMAERHATQIEELRSMWASGQMVWRSADGRMTVTEQLSEEKAPSAMIPEAFRVGLKDVNLWTV